MMETAFSAITGAIIAALKVAPAVLPDAAISRARDRPIPESMPQAISVQWVGADPDAGAIKDAPVDWRTTIVVECYASSKSDSGDVAVDPLLKAVYERLASDSTLGGLVDDLGVPRLVAEFNAEGKKTGWVQMMYPVLHSTNNFNLSA